MIVAKDGVLEIPALWVDVDFNPEFAVDILSSMSPSKNGHFTSSKLS